MATNVLSPHNSFWIISLFLYQSKFNLSSSLIKLWSPVASTDPLSSGRTKGDFLTGAILPFLAITWLSYFLLDSFHLAWAHVSKVSYTDMHCWKIIFCIPNNSWKSVNHSDFKYDGISSFHPNFCFFLVWKCLINILVCKVHKIAKPKGSYIFLSLASKNIADLIGYRGLNIFHIFNRGRQILKINNYFLTQVAECSKRT